MQIAPINPEKDLPEVEEVIRKAFSETPDSNIEDWFSLSEMQKVIKDGLGACLKAVRDKKIAGIISVQNENPINGREGREKWVITNAAVLPEFQGQGIGGELLEAIEVEAKQRGAIKMYVHTNEGDDEVIRFYKKYGYQDAGGIKDYYYEGSAVFLLKYLE